MQVIKLVGCYFSKNYNNITYPIDSEDSPGFRNAQLGAIYSIGSYGPYLLGKLTNRCSAVGISPQPVGN